MIQIKNILSQISGHLRNKKGFTLVEILVTVLIFSVLAAAVNTVLLAGDSSWQTNNVQVELQQDLRKAMDWMKDDIRQTGSIAIDNVPADGTWYTTITFQKAIGIDGGSIEWNNDGASPSNEITTQFVLGGADSNQLQRLTVTDDGDDATNTTTVVANNIQAVQFRRLASVSKVVEVDIDAQKTTVKGAVITSSLDFKVQLRN